MKVSCTLASTKEVIEFADHRQVDAGIQTLFLAYESSVTVNTIAPKVFLNSWANFIESVKLIQEGKNIKLEDGIPFCFTKLPFLYKDLKSNGKFKHPIVFLDDLNWNGCGRLMVSQIYFPHIKVDILHNYTVSQESKQHLSFQQIVDKLSGLEYYNNFNHDELIMRFFMGMNNEIEDVEFDTTHDVKNRGYETSPFQDLIMSSHDVWQRQLTTIRNWRISKPNDYTELLDALIFENLDLT